MGSPPTCPACSAACADPPLFRYTAEQAAAHFCPPVREPDRNARLRRCVERLWGGDDCEVLRCRECGFGFGRPFVGGDEEFYSILHEQAGYPAWRWDYDVALDKVIRGRLYRIGDRRLRAPLLAAAGGLFALGMLPHVRELRRGGAFAMIGTVPAPERPRGPTGPGPKKAGPEQEGPEGS